MKRTKLFLSLFALAVSGLLAWAWLAPAALEDSPDITLVTIDGERLRLANLHGKPLLLVFWATSCPGCLKEMPHLIDLYRELSPRGLEIVAVAMRHDRPSDVVSMRKSRNLPYPVALDLDGSAARAFGDVRVTPTSFLVAPDGRIVYRNTGRLDMGVLRSDIIAMLPRDAHPQASQTGDTTGS